MISHEFLEFDQRVSALKAQFLPEIDPMGFYAEEQQDSMRALRMLIHAEVEAYLETACRVLLAELNMAIENQIFGPVVYVWAKNNSSACHLAINSNNGVGEIDIKKMFGPLGITSIEYDSVSPIFLNRMTAFGRHRGDVAHQSALRATHSLNSGRESATIDELVDLLRKFDETLIAHKIRGFV